MIREIMIVKEYIGLDTLNRKRIYVDVKCQICSTIFSRQKRQLHEQYHCCSPKCLSLAKGTALILVCDHCGNNFHRAVNRIENSKSRKYFCSRTCKDTAQRYMVEIQPDHYGIGTGVYSYRSKAFNHYKPICIRCGYDNILALEVHHKDKNRDNNSMENLEILCSNCHTIEHKT